MPHELFGFRAVQTLLRPYAPAAWAEDTQETRAFSPEEAKAFSQGNNEYSVTIHTFSNLRSSPGRREDFLVRHPLTLACYELPDDVCGQQRGRTWVSWSPGSY